MTDTKDTMNRGQELLKMGDIAGALILLEEAVLRSEEIGDSAGQIEPLQLLSRIYELKKEAGKAIETSQRLLAIYKVMDDPFGQGRVLNNIGLLKARSERYEDAIQYFQTALDLFESQGETRRAAEQFGNIGSVYRDMKKYEEALLSYQRGLSLFESLDHKEGVADQHTNIAYIHVMTNRPRKALACYKDALRLYEKVGSEQKADFTRQNLENVEQGIG